MHADERFTGEAGEPASIEGRLHVHALREQPAYSPPTARRHLLLAPRVDGTHRASGVSEINSDGDTHLVG